MVFARYLAMTADELASASPPEQLCYLACHFSPYGFGLCNIPDTLPPGAMLCVNDRIPIQSHDPALVASQLARAVDVLEAGSVLLEFRRGGDVFVDAILRELSCPVGVWEGDARGRDCPVFLDCPEVNVPIDRHLAPWQGREIWLEEHKPIRRFTVTKDGCAVSDGDALSGTVHRDDKLHCSYTVATEGEAAVFTLTRTQKDWDAMVQKAAALGVTRTVGLYRQCIP